MGLVLNPKYKLCRYTITYITRTILTGRKTVLYVELEQRKNEHLEKGTQCSENMKKRTKRASKQNTHRNVGNCAHK